MLSEKSYLKRKISLAEENNSTKSNKGAARVFNETDMVSKEINRFVMEAIIKYRSPSIIVIKKVCTSVNFFFFCEEDKKEGNFVEFSHAKEIVGL